MSRPARAVAPAPRSPSLRHPGSPRSPPHHPPTSGRVVHEEHPTSGGAAPGRRRGQTEGRGTGPRGSGEWRLLIFLNIHRIIRKRTEDTIVALHPEVFRVS